jgi:hypothetical protein
VVSVAGVATPTVNVSESASVGTVFARVLATDPNRGLVWGARIYSIVQSWDSRFFSINASSGELRIGAPSAAFWDQPSFFIVVAVQDADPIAPIIVTFNVSVQLIQVNTVVVSRFAAAPGTPASVALNASDAALSPVYASYVPTGIDVLLTTRGYSQLLVFGSGFGRTAARLVREGTALTPSAIAAATVVTASLGSLDAPLASRVAVACVVVVPGTMLSCALPPGVGANLTLAVWIEGWPAMSSTAVSYMPPSITTVVRVGSGSLVTEGTDMLSVTGDNFGPSGTAGLLSYAQNATKRPLLYAPPACTLTVAHSEFVCPTLPGVGNGLVFSLSVAGQPNAPGIFSPSPPVQYVNPVISAVTAPLLRTSGGEAVIMLNGTGFGPFVLPDGSSAPIHVQYCANFTAADAVVSLLRGSPLYTESVGAEFYPSGVSPIFTARGCAVDSSAPFAVIRCTSSPGVGANLDVRVTIAGLTSPVLPSALSYAPPLITSVGGIGADLCPTEGGGVVTLIGTQFGPVTPLDEEGNALAGNALQPLAWYGPNGTKRYNAVACVVRVANTQIDCLTAPGSGTGHLWSVSIGSQVSPVLSTRPTSYHPPIVSMETGPGAASAETFGGELVLISGRNFGPRGTSIDSALYTAGSNDSAVFTARNCSLSQPHIEVRCGGGGAVADTVSIQPLPPTFCRYLVLPPLVPEIHFRGL